MRHFTFREFRPKGADELPPLYERAVRRLVDVWLDPLREEFGRTVVHSGMRTAAGNRAVGGAPRSKHRYRSQPSVAAADVSCERGTPEEWAEFLARLNPVCGIGVYPDHVHIDSRRTPSRWSGR